MNLKSVMPFFRNSIRALLTLALVCAFLQWSALPTAAAYQFNLVGPPGSGQFGFTVTALPNGNLVVTDPFYNEGGNTDVGAVYLYNGVTFALISTLTGSTANDMVGLQGVKVLTNGNYVIQSPLWNNGTAATMAGAATWGSMTTGVSGVVSSDNSLVGSTADDQVGMSVTALTNGNYVVSSPLWDAPGPIADVGAATWVNGATGLPKGVVQSSNSLVGSTADDRVGDVSALTNGNYVVKSPYWDGVTTNTGAATWVNGATGLPKGVVQSSNSLVGSKIDDMVGMSATPLTNGNYVVNSYYWDGAAADTGAATWVNGATGQPRGSVSSDNSLVGSTASDQVSSWSIPLTNGNYVVCSPKWDGSVVDAGAATFGNGTTGLPVGAVTSTNSLVGSTSGDNVGHARALTNGNYVVLSPYWDSPGPVADVGAATWVDGASGLPKGAVSISNSLYGSTANDYVGASATALANNGNFVVQSPSWNSVGAATWVNGASGLPKGPVNFGNSLVGSTAGDWVGLFVAALTNGNYVVASPNWDGSAVDAGAATWGDGDTGITGLISSSNSLVGSQLDDEVSSGFVQPLTNGDYVVISPYWDGSAADVGAATWGNGASGLPYGAVSSSNSLVGSTTGDNVGIGIFPDPLIMGDYVMRSPFYDYGGTLDSGAVTWGTAGANGPISGDNSVFGLVASKGNLRFSYNQKFVYLAVGKPAENTVTLFWLSRIFTPVIKK